MVKNRTVHRVHKLNENDIYNAKLWLRICENDIYNAKLHGGCLVHYLLFVCNPFIYISSKNVNR